MKQHPRAFSFEFFPPKTPEGKAKLRAAWQQLAQLKPRFFSVTFGAGGSTQQGTLETVLEIRKEGHEAAPHLSCVASSKADIAAILANYKANGIRHIVALRGDLPSGVAMAGELRIQLLQLQPRHFLVEVLGQGVDADRVLRCVAEQFDLRDGLIGER